MIDDLQGEGVMTRNDKILAGLDMSTMVGIEIGPLNRPLIPRSSPRVFYVDYTDTETLRAKYATDPNVDENDIVEVDGVWGDRALADIAASVAPVDVIVASHVIEHVPDLITWLRELASVLKEDGQVRLAIPDRRFTFDYLRLETQTADVLSAFVVRARVPQPRQVLDFALHMAHVDCAQAWAGTLDAASLVKGYDPAGALHLASEALAGKYHDVHCWVFTPLSFAKLMGELGELGLLSFKCASFFDTAPNTIEFFISLQHCRDKEALITSWKQMQKTIELQESEKVSGSVTAHVDMPAAPQAIELPVTWRNWLSMLRSR